MPKFMIGIGHDLDLEPVDPLDFPLAPFMPYQPKTPGLQYARRSPTIGGVFDEGAFILFTFGLLDETQYQALLAQAGLTTEKTSEVTLYAQDVNYVWGYFEGIAIKPVNLTRRGYFLYDVPLLIKKVEAIAP